MLAINANDHRWHHTATANLLRLSPRATLSSDAGSISSINAATSSSIECVAPRQCIRLAVRFCLFCTCRHHATEHGRGGRVRSAPSASTPGSVSSSLRCIYFLSLSRLRHSAPTTSPTEDTTTSTSTSTSTVFSAASASDAPSAPSSSAPPATTTTPPSSSSTDDSDDFTTVFVSETVSPTDGGWRMRIQEWEWAGEDSNGECRYERTRCPCRGAVFAFVR
ncbi:hypothetical protein B0H19DRAFT_1245480 [Mycena capillaripes]|nr:hypothetical protein B0H19DRAFT_1245480 [Mycena capillaripes]